jgi:diguanylate cyclase (GGDEF)-like protein
MNGVVRGIELIALVLPLFLVSMVAYRPAIRSWTALWVAVIFCIVSLATGIVNVQRLRNNRITTLRPEGVLAEIMLAMAALFSIVVAVGVHGGVYLLLPCLPFLVVTLLGNLRMILMTWLFLMLGLAISTAVQLSARDATWLTLLFGFTAGAVAMMIHTDLTGALRGAALNRALADVAARAGTLRNWPDDLADISNRLARAMDVDHYMVLARAGRGEPVVQAFAWPDQSWLSDDQLGDLPDMALHASNTVVARGLCVVAATVGDASIVVVTPEQSSQKVLLDQNVGLTVAVLLATMFDRSRLISGLVDQANTDELTRLANRRRLFDTLEVERERHRRYQKPLSVAMMDIDHFKEFNDQFGHTEGDLLLRQVADSVVGRVRGKDLFARYGGEEFCLVLPETSAESAVRVLESIRHNGIGAGPDGHPVTFSAGIATWDFSEPMVNLINRADFCLYEAKDGGRDRVVASYAPDVYNGTETEPGAPVPLPFPTLAPAESGTPAGPTRGDRRASDVPSTKGFDHIELP